MLPLMNGQATHGMIKSKSRDRTGEGKKTLISFLSFAMTMALTSWVAVIVNDRRPDENTHPPLPDLFLENINPNNNAHFVMAGTLFILGSTLGVTLAFHTYRHVILQRYFSSIIVLYIWRNFTLVVTSLPLAHHHIPCAPKTDGTLEMRTKQALEEFLTLGATTGSGVICGDYLYSGHTLSYIYLTYYATRYCPNIACILHPIMWITCVVGILSLLVSFNHYSVDVVVSLILAPVFLTLHEVLVENPSLRPKYKFHRLLFPLMSFLEGDRSDPDSCIIHNIYDFEFINSRLKRCRERL
ncbi:sphingomyelin synthase-related protein 1-like [Glandiceps talaboti]